MPEIELRIFADRCPWDSALGEPDPLIELIRAYKRSMADYIKNAPDDWEAANAYAEKSFRLSRQRLKAWDAPAATFRGAVSALRMAKDADLNDDAEVVSSMVKAALGYFDALH